MGDATQDQLFASIDANVRLGTVALRQSLLWAKSSLARNRGVPVATLTRVSALLLAAQYEARLNWLTWHPWSRLTQEQRRETLTGGVSSRWESLLRVGLVVRLAEGEPALELGAADVPKRLPAPHRGIYYDLRRIRKSHLDPLIDNRNSLAHGEWAVALTRDAAGVNMQRTKRIEDLSLFRVVITANLLDHFWKCYFDALVTYQALERDFATHHRRMMHAATRLTSADEEKWVFNLRQRFAGGKTVHGGLSMPPETWGMRLPELSVSEAGTVLLGKTVPSETLRDLQ